MAFSLLQREANPAERAFLSAKGQVGTVAGLRAMAIAGDKGSALVELKAVDGSYPAVGTLETDPQLPPAELLAQRNGAFGAAADPVLLARLDMKVGDRVTVGDATVEFRASLRLRTRQDRQRHRPRAAPPRLAGGARGDRARAAGQPRALDLPPDPAAGARDRRGLAAGRGGGRRGCCPRPAGASAPA